MATKKFTRRRTAKPVAEPASTPTTIGDVRDDMLRLNALLVTIRDSFDEDIDWREWRVIDQANSMLRVIDERLEVMENG